MGPAPVPGVLRPAEGGRERDALRQAGATGLKVALGWERDA